MVGTSSHPGLSRRCNHFVLMLVVFAECVWCNQARLSSFVFLVDSSREIAFDRLTLLI